ncbi:restriction endonuclease subunit S [Empedobacter stercoris]|uniref:restriction endonuclease subunit S n=1 Tax=Empedobacter stercoris TaxID=1628248 RepID=UPI001CE1D64A|nr:restriction endonuclease subunit S [Empedobacter stercoris]MCA4783139.1 restriction endonuclease subunit S [Empedobacter stercoris]
MVLDNIDKSNWESFPFEKIAKRIAETVDPKNTDLEIYYGLEHLDGETIHIRRNGTPDDVKGGKLKCYPGDIIFGKRRAYQRKAGIVKQAGICSAHAFVFRANEELIDARLFPFFLHSDQFMHRMVDISVGGLSPTINWSDLKHQEFLLPPKDQQAELADLLWAMDEVIEKDLEVILRYKSFYHKNINELTSRKNKYCKNEYLLSDLGETYNGLNGKTKIDFGEGERYINYLNVYRNFEINEKEFDLVRINSNENQNQVKYGDIIFTGSSETPDEVGLTSVVLKDLRNYYLNSFCFGFRLFDFSKLDPRYAKFLFRNSEIRNFLNLRAQGSTRFNLSKTDLKNKLILHLPDVEKQLEIYNNLNDLELNVSKLKSKLQSSKALQKALINQMF